MMSRLEHPARDAITLEGVLHALADPARLAIYRRIAEGAATSCTATAPAEMPRSTRSHHFKVLREAGLIRSERRGAEVVNSCRQEDVEARFPGLLRAIAAATDG